MSSGYDIAIASMNSMHLWLSAQDQAYQDFIMDREGAHEVQLLPEGLLITNGC